MMAAPGRPYTVRTLAERWECSESHVYNLIQRGELAAKRLGKLIRIPAAAVARFEEIDTWPDCANSDGPRPSTSSGAKDDRVVEFRQGRAIAKKPSAP